MLSVGAATRVYLACGATDMRKGFDGLYSLVKHNMQADPLSGHLFLFCNSQRTRLKVLFWDGSGLWVCAKRLERGCFSWPKRAPEGEGRAVINSEELALLLGGIDLGKARPKSWWRLEPSGLEAEPFKPAMKSGVTHEADQLKAGQTQVQ